MTLGSPAQRLVSRQTRTTLPVSRMPLEPQVYKPLEVKARLLNKRLTQKLYYDRSSRPLRPLMGGQVVRMQTPHGYNRTGRVKEICKEPRSYLIHSEGKLYRRNRRHILPVVEPAPAQHYPDDSECQDSGHELNNQQTPTKVSHNTLNTEQSHMKTPDITGSLYITRYGRVSKPNPKYKD